MSRAMWYWHRLRAMSAAEVAGHVRKKLRQKKDARELPDFCYPQLCSAAAFPILPPPEKAPEKLKTCLAKDAAEIIAGRWTAFGHLHLQVDDPPRWHKDYLANVDVASTTSAFRLDHRELPKGADSKLIWELSRWNQLVRLAQAAFVLIDRTAATTVVRWLEDWLQSNPPYHGWNWTSALESGMRLIQFTWIDALLGKPEFELSLKLSELRQQLLPAHAWFTWRYRSFGSSANNHLLGELAGLIVAQTRWPQSAKWGYPDLGELQRLFEMEVLAQFAADGGNREQALNYQLFSFEFCWQARMAFLAAGKTLAPEVEDRLRQAAEFFVQVQAEREFWDYGDSDSAFVTPFFADNSVLEWRDWFRSEGEVEALQYWLGAPPQLKSGLMEVSLAWSVYPDSGIALHRDSDWLLRFDLSELGYLSMAAHGHLDALHLSIWLKDVAFIIDPGTGAYYANKALRSTLASWDAHNAPHPGALNFPVRLGPFLWSNHHRKPTWQIDGEAIYGELDLATTKLRRRITKLENGWLVEDACGRGEDFVVNWQFAPGTIVRSMTERVYHVERSGIKMEVRLSDAWHNVLLINESDPNASIVSPAFRRTEVAPVIRLSGRSECNRKTFQTSFVAL